MSSSTRQLRSSEAADSSTSANTSPNGADETTEKHEGKRAATPFVNSKFVSIRRMQNTRKLKKQIEYDSTPEKSDSQSDASNERSKNISFQSLRRVLEPTKNRAKSLIKTPNLGAISEESITRDEESSARSLRSRDYNVDRDQYLIISSASSGSMVSMTETNVRARRVMKSRSISPNYSRQKSIESSSSGTDASLSSVSATKRKSLSPVKASTSQKSKMDIVRKVVTRSEKKIEEPLELASPKEVSSESENETASNKVVTRRQSARLVQEPLASLPSPRKRKSTENQADSRDKSRSRSASPRKQSAKWLKINDQIEIMYNDEDDDEGVRVQIGDQLIKEPVPISTQNEPEEPAAKANECATPVNTKLPLIVIKKLNTDDLSSPNKRILRINTYTKQVHNEPIVSNEVDAAQEDSDSNKSYDSIRIGSTISDVIDATNRAKSRVNRVLDDDEDEEMVIQSAQEFHLPVDDQILGTQRREEIQVEERAQNELLPESNQRENNQDASEASQTKEFFSFMSRHIARPVRVSNTPNNEQNKDKSTWSSILSYVFDSFQF